MRELTESIVREHLATVTAERDIAVTRIDRISDDVDRLGRPFTARQRMLQIWEARLRAARLSAPDDRAGHQWCESRVSALRAVGPDEPLYSWGAKTAGEHYYSGISTPVRIISLECTDDFHPPLT